MSTSENEYGRESEEETGEKQSNMLGAEQLGRNGRRSRRRSMEKEEGEAKSVNERELVILPPITPMKIIPT